MIYGYARVSTQDQDLSMQMEMLKSAGCKKIFPEKISGVRVTRPQLSRMMAALEKGDTIIVTKLDRLGRSVRELLDLLVKIKEAGASFKSLGDPLWDTTSPQGRLLAVLLAAIAEFERELIIERTGAGRARALARGVKFGPKPALDAFQSDRAKLRRDAGEPVTLIARDYGVHPSTIYRL